MHKALYINYIVRTCRCSIGIRWTTCICNCELVACGTNLGLPEDQRETSRWSILNYVSIIPRSAIAGDSHSIRAISKQINREFHWAFADKCPMLFLLRLLSVALLTTHSAACHCYRRSTVSEPTLNIRLFWLLRREEICSKYCSCQRER